VGCNQVLVILWLWLTFQMAIAIGFLVNTGKNQSVPFRLFSNDVSCGEAYMPSCQAKRLRFAVAKTITNWTRYMQAQKNPGGG